MKERVLQFGTGNFLRGFADAFLQTVNDRGLFDGGAVIVSPTDSKTVDRLNAAGCGYHLALRGVSGGKTVDEIRKIACVTRALNPYRDFEGFLELAQNPDLTLIISNTTEAGIAYDPACAFSDRPAASFPGKLTQFLFARWQSGLSGLTVLPCELIDGNAEKLLDCVERYIARWGLSEAFLRWVKTENRFYNTLVDRIVSGYNAELGEQWSDPLLDVAEPYHLWVIGGNTEDILPLQAAGLNAVYTDDVTPYKKIKVRVLNGMHTSLVFPGLLTGAETVADCMADPDLTRFLDSVLTREILPALDNAPEAAAFAADVRERFMNPYLNHRLASIALNSVSKFGVRVLPTLKDSMERTGEAPKTLCLSLACLLKYYRENEVSDDPAAVTYIREHTTEEVLKNASLWGEDLGFLTNPVLTAQTMLSQNPIREVLRWSVS